MSAVDMPLMIRTERDLVELWVRLARPTTLAEVAPALCRAAGLARDTPLFHGIGRADGAWLLGTPPLLAGGVLSTAPERDIPDDPAVTLDVVAGPEAGASVALGTRTIRLGRAADNDLVVDDPALSAHHATITATATGMAVTDLDSTNGVFVDGVPIDGEATAHSGSTIRVGHSIVRPRLATPLAGGFTADDAGHLVRAHRRPRQHERPPVAPDRPAPPDRGPRRALPIGALVTGLALGGGLAIFLHQPMFLAFAAFGPLTMAATTLADKIRGRRSYRRERAEYRAAYRRWEQDSAAAVESDRRIAWRLWPGPAELLRRARHGDAQLWDRGPADPAYLTVAAGTGSRPLRTAAHAGESDRAVTDEPPTVADVPLTVGIRGVVRLTGSTGRALARWLLAQLATTHSPADVAFAFLSARPDLRGCRYLPHTLHWITDQGQAPGPDEMSADGRDLVVVIDGPAAAASPCGTALITAAAAAPQPSPATPPLTQGGRQPCRVSVLLLDCPAEKAAVGTRGAGSDPAGKAATALTPAALAPTGLTLTGLGESLFIELCRALTPLREGNGIGATPLPGRVTLPSLVGPMTRETIRDQWRSPRATATIGAGPEGPATIDLDADGPHLLIAGTTGSGKSELLQTLVAGLAVAASPHDMTLLLVDYKGGAAFDAIAELPHVVGMLTDLDPALSARALASLRAELRKRESRQANGQRPGPKLAVVIDEFATLAVELPEFLSGVLDIAQRGRSLGVHLILATQRPAGVVSPAMRANISCRICLRVTDPSDSADVIDSPEAARLPARYPGRAILRTHDTAQPFQTALVSAPTPLDIDVTHLDANAARTGSVPPGSTAVTPPAPSPTPPPSPAPSILSAIVEAARELAAHDDRPESPWLPPLPTHLDADDHHPDAFALADLPDEQRQRYLTPPPCSLLVTGPPGSGRSTALRRLAVLAAERGDELLVIDPTGALANLRGHPHVSTYLDLAEPRLVLRLIRLLADTAAAPGDGRIRQLVIDHYDMVAGELERTDYLTGATALAELTTRSAGTVRLLASGPTSLTHSRAAATFPALVELDDTEGRVIPGRGRYDAQAVQIINSPAGAGALPGSDPDSDSNPEPGPDPDPDPDPDGNSTVSSPWPDPIIVRPVPTAVPFAALPTPCASRLPIGIGGDAARPVSIGLDGPGGGLVVSGPRRSGVSTTLEVIATQAADAAVPVIRVTVGHRAEAGYGADSPALIDVADGMEPLRAALARHTGPLLLMVDRCGPDHPAGPLFEQFLSVCDRGQHLVVGARPETLARARSGYLAAVLACRRGVLLSPDAADGAVLDVTVPKRTNGVMPGRGLWVDDGTVTPIQVATPPAPACAASRSTPVD